MFGILPISAEIFICFQVLYLLLVGVILNEKKINEKYKFNVSKWIGSFSSLALFFAIIILCNTIHFEAYTINYQVTIDNLAFFLKFFVILMSFFSFIAMSDYEKYENIKVFEYKLLLLLAVIGVLTLISSNDLITMYLSLELQSLSFYIVTNIKFYSNFSIEAGLKYFVLGALSSGILLFGASLIYGFTGSTNFLDFSLLLHYYNIDSYNLYQYKITLLGLLFLYSGLLFKIGIVPFHMWISDIYEGAPTNIGLFFAVVPQIGIFSTLIRLNIIFLKPYYNYLNMLFIILGMLSIVVGTLGAIYQTKLKRVFAYSSISNMGYAVLLLCTLNIESVFAVLFYVIVYNMINLGLWFILLSIRNRSTKDTLKDVSDVIILYNSNKYLAISLLLLLFSGMGIPPLLGFFSKLYVFTNLIELEMYFCILILIIINSIGAIYFLRLITFMFSYKTEKRIFIEDIGEIKSILLILLLILNLFYFLYPIHLSILMYNIIIAFFLY
jgi:NADH-quinone oxidoreductase subunit N